MRLWHHFLTVYIINFLKFTTLKRFIFIKKKKLLFYRRDSFITHRAFCDAFQEESNEKFSKELQDISPTWLPLPQAQSACMSATALLQKAAQMGAIMSTNSNNTPPFQEQMASHTFTQASSFHGSSPFEEAVGGFMGSGKEERRIDEGMTRDFLGLRALSHGGILNLALLDPNCINSSSFEQQ